MLFESVRLALKAIERNALRSFLTVLGIVIGVGAVIAMVTIGNGTTAKVTADIAKLGSNLLSVSPGQFGPGRASSEAKAFNARDVEAMRTQLNGVKAVAPVSQKSDTIIYGTESRTVTVAGTNNDYFVTQDWPLKAGRRVSGRRIARRPGDLHHRLDRSRKAARSRRSVGTSYSRQQRLLRGDRPAARVRANRTSAPIRTTSL